MKEEEEERRAEEEERKRKEEKERREEEEYQKLKASFAVEESGFDEEDAGGEEDDRLRKFVDYIKATKVSKLDVTFLNQAPYPLHLCQGERHPRISLTNRWSDRSTCAILIDFHQR